jgi:hypothetical protein
MRVQVIKESTGFGFTSKAVSWISSDPENLNSVNRLKDGQIVEIPERIAHHFHNLVNVETGKIISLSFNLNKGTSVDKIKQAYKKEEDRTQIRQDVSRVLKANKPKSARLKKHINKEEDF